MFKLHIGCGERKLDGFVNIDKDGNPDLKIDVRYGLPFPDESVDFIFAEHFIEHLSRDEGILFLREAYRVLKKGGVCRIATPNLATQIDRYINNSWKEAEWIHRFRYEWIPNRCVMFNIALREWGHQYLYDFEDLEMIGNLAGFLICEKKEVGESDFPDLQNLEHRYGSSVVEFTKESEAHYDNLPLVSICIPAYNPRFFGEALLSALNQTYLNCEIVVCDDSPGKEIEKITRSFNDDRIRYYKNPKTIGAWKNYLQVLSRAQGKYIKYLNDDDILHPECVKTMVSYMEAYKNRVSLVTSKRNMIDEKGNLLPDIYSTRLLSDKDFYVSGIDFGNLVLAQAVNVIGEPTTVMFRREDATEFEKLFHYFYEGNRGVGDIVMWLCLLSKGDGIYLSQPFSSFREHPEQSQKDPSKMFVLVKSWYYLVTKSRLLGFLKQDDVYREALKSVVRLFRYYLDHFAFTLEESQDLSGTIEEIEKELPLLTGVDGASYQMHIYPIIRNASILQPTQTALEVQYRYILELVQKNFTMEAIEALKALVRQFPNFTEALNDLGVLYFSQGDVARAIEMLEECLRRDPKNILALENLRDVYVKLGKTQKAEHYNTMIKSIQNGQQTTVKDMTFSAIKEKVDKMIPLEYSPQTISRMPQNISSIKVSIVIPVFNKVEFTERCLSALFARTPFDIPWEVIVIDNASSDRTPEFLQEMAQQYSVLRWIRNTENLGFAGACNQGALNSSGEYILFLNNDTEVQENWLHPLVDLLDRDFRVGAVGSKLLFPDGSIQHAGVVIVDRREIGDPLCAMNVHYKKFLDKDVVNAAHFYQAVTAACVLVRREAFEQVGGFDENYWNGYEDVDLCFKLQEKGWMIVYEPRSVLIHYESQSGPERFRKVRENVTRLHKRWVGKITPDFVVFPGNVAKAVQPVVIKPYCPPLVSLIILTLNNLEYTQRCLESIYQYTPQAHEIIVVDNGSVDGTIEFLRSQPSVKLIQNDDNLGFALGNNRGLLEARGNYIVFLNNDVVVTEGWLVRLIFCAESDPRVGIVGPRSNYVAGHQVVRDVSYGEDMEKMQEFAEEWSQNRMKQWEYVNRVIGFCMLVKREVVDRIGGFDPTFGLGNFEDDDFCIRAQIAGFRIKVAHDVFIHHFGSRTFQGEQIDYRELMYTNWEKFKTKWDLPRESSLGQGYPIEMLIRRNFQEVKHRVPLQFVPYHLDGVHQVKYGACFSPQVLFWYLDRFQAHDDVTLILYKEGNGDCVFQEVLQTIQKVGFDPENIPDVLLLSEPLDEFGIAALIQAVDIVLFTSDTPSSWRRWATYLGKKKEEILSVS